MGIWDFYAVLELPLAGFALIGLKFVMAIWIVLKEKMRKIVGASKVKYFFSIRINSPILLF